MFYNKKKEEGKKDNRWTIWEWCPSRRTVLIATGMAVAGYTGWKYRGSIQIGAQTLFSSSGRLGRALMEPSIIGAAIQTVGSSATSAYVSFRLNDERVQEDQNRYNTNSTYLQIEKTEKELDEAMQSGEFHTASKCAQILFQAYLEIYDTIPNKSSARAIEKKINEVRYARALALTHMGKYEIENSSPSGENNALCIINNIIKEDPENVDALILRGFIYLQYCRWREAEEDFSAALKEYPNQNIILIMKLYARIKAGTVPHNGAKLPNPVEGSVLLPIKESNASSDTIEKDKGKEKEETFPMAGQMPSSTEHGSVAHMAGNQFSLFPNQPKAKELARRIISRMELRDKGDIFSITLCQIYIESNMILNKFEHAIALCMLGLCYCGNDPVFLRNQLRFYELMAKCYEELEIKFDTLISSSSVSSSSSSASSSSAGSANTISIPTDLENKKSENLTKAQIQERKNLFLTKSKMLSDEINSESKGENENERQHKL